MVTPTINLTSLMTTAQQNLVSSLYGTQATTTKAADPMMTILQGEEQMLSLSTIGMAASKVHAVALKSGDAQVVSGVQQAMQALYTEPMSVDALLQLHTATQLAEEAPATFNTVFKTVDTLAGSGLDTAIQPYLTAVSMANLQSGSTGVTDLNTAVATAMSAGSTSAATLQALAGLFSQYSQA
ncbi:MAG TPA: hypothetical protein VGM23_02630 [Armatimonadota bacterium]|jgi:hypothetical protein